MTSAHRGWLFAGLIAIGCAHAPPAANTVQAPPPVPPPRIKLAVLPVDGVDFPGIARSLNNVLHDVKVKGVDDYFLSKATLEVVQLSIECVEQTSACYSAVGKQLGANKLLLGHIAPAGRKKRDKSVRVTITLFDVDAGEPTNVVDHVYRTADAASAGAMDLVAEATGEPPRYYGPDEEPAGKGAKSSVARGDKRAVQR